MTDIVNLRKNSKKKSMSLPVLVPKYHDLAPFFPELKLCQTWKLPWLSGKLMNASEHTVRVLEQYG